MVVLVRKARPSLVILLDARMPVVDVQGGRHAFGDNARSKAAGRSFRDATFNQKSHLFGSTGCSLFRGLPFQIINVREGPIQTLREGKLSLQDGNLVVVTGRAFGGGERLRQTRQPLPHEGVNLFRRQRIRQRLQAGRVGARQNAIVPGVVDNPRLG